MRKIYLSLCMLAFGSIFYSCQKTLDRNASEEILGTTNHSSLTPPTLCGTPTNYPIVDMGNAVVGNLRITNDASNYYLTLSENLAEYKIEEVRWIYGTEAHVRNALLGLFFCGSQNPTQVDQTTFHNPGVDQVNLTLPFTTVPGDCFFLHVHVKVVKRDPVTGQEYFSFWIWNDGPFNASQNPCQDYVKHCKQQCPPADCGQLRTQTQGGWGAEPHGNNPGKYLHANFAAAFPGGLTVGCASKYTVKYTTAAAITEFLPAGGTAAVLKASVVNPPDKSIKNVLIGQVTALALNVGFDNYDPNFGQAGVHLGDMIISSGPFAGKTVSQFLAIANDVLGGCSTAYTPTQVNETASKINENYVDGKTDNRFLNCPGTPER